MSSNRLMYDTCEYQTRLNEMWNLRIYAQSMRNENCNKCHGIKEPWMELM